MRGSQNKLKTLNFPNSSQQKSMERPSSLPFEIVSHMRKKKRFLYELMLSSHSLWSIFIFIFFFSFSREEKDVKILLPFFVHILINVSMSSLFRFSLTSIRTSHTVALVSLGTLIRYEYRYAFIENED